MFDNICSLPLSSDLFAQAIHPTEPIFSVGLSGGHVQTYRLPPKGADLAPATGYVGAADNGGRKTNLTVRGRRSSEDGFGTVGTVWRTRRHKGSCRTLAFSDDGNTLFSAGTDGLLKAAETETGRVSAKLALPLYGTSSTPADPSILHVLSPQTLLLGTDTSHLHVYDLRASSFTSSTPSQTFRPHLPADDPSYAEPITSLTALPPTSGSTSGFARSWASTAGSTLAVTDLRKGVVRVSEDQGDVLLSAVSVAGLALTRAETKRRRGNAGAEQADKVLVGGADGVLTFWERGAWEDQSGRVVVHRDGSGGVGEEGTIDALALLPAAEGKMRMVAAGLGNGLIRFVRLGVGANQVVGEVSHDEMRVEGVAALGFDVEGRMISGGGQIVKLWHEKISEEQDRGGEDGDDDSDDGASGDGRDVDAVMDEEEVAPPAVEFVQDLDQSEDEENSDEDSDDDSRSRSKKKRKGRGKDKGGSHGLMHTFKGLD